MHIYIQTQIYIYTHCIYIYIYIYTFGGVNGGTDIMLMCAQCVGQPQKHEQAHHQHADQKHVPIRLCCFFILFFIWGENRVDAVSVK